MVCLSCIQAAMKGEYEKHYMCANADALTVAAKENPPQRTHCDCQHRPTATQAANAKNCEDAKGATA